MRLTIDEVRLTNLPLLIAIVAVTAVTAAGLKVDDIFNQIVTDLP